MGSYGSCGSRGTSESVRAAEYSLIEPVVIFDAVLGIDEEPSKTRELRDAVELDTYSYGLLQVVRIQDVRSDPVREDWEARLSRLGQRCQDPAFPKPTWKDAKVTTAADAIKRRQQLEVYAHLDRISNRHADGGRSVSAWHGTSRGDIAHFATDLRMAKGWTCEGVYTSTMPCYSLRHAFGMSDHWDNLGKRGFLIAGKVAWCQVYPATYADNEYDPLVPGLKGKALGTFPGSEGCDAAFALVQGVAPCEEYTKRTYHCCFPKQAPDGTELVVDQETQVLPEYVLEVLVKYDPDTARVAKMTTANWSRWPEVLAKSGVAVERFQPEVTKLDHSQSNLAGADLKQIVDGVVEGSQLTEINFEQNPDLFKDGVGLAELSKLILNHKQLEKVNLNWTSPTSLVLSELARTVPADNNITELCFAGATDIADRMDGDAENNSGMQALKTMLLKCGKLQRLSLEASAKSLGLSGGNFNFLIDAIPDGKKIIALDIGGNHLFRSEESRHAGVEALQCLLSKCPNLEQLGLRCTGLQGGDTKALADALPSSSKLAELWVNTNSDLFRDGSCARAYQVIFSKCASLALLDFWNTGMKGSDLTELADALPSNNAIRVINFGYNNSLFAGEVAWRACKALILKCSELQTLHLNHVRIQGAVLAELADALLDSSNITEIDMSGASNRSLFGDGLAVKAIKRICSKCGRLERFLLDYYLQSEYEAQFSTEEQRVIVWSRGCGA